MTAVKAVSLLRYNGVTVDEVDSDKQNLLSKQYADRCYYPFSSYTPLSIESFSIIPSKLNSYWVLKDYGENGGTVTVDIPVGEYNELDSFTFELMVVKTTEDTGTISFAQNINWLGSAPDFITNAIYFLVFRAVYYGNSWKIVGNVQGSVGI